MSGPLYLDTPSVHLVDSEKCELIIKNTKKTKLLQIGCIPPESNGSEKRAGGKHGHPLMRAAHTVHTSHLKTPFDVNLHFMNNL